jgi:hypothetical protein
MKRFIKYPSIEQFRSIIRDVTHTARFDGLDEDNNPIYKNVELPTITAVATEKIHGTNAAVCYSHSDGMWVQSRKNIITPEKDNAACAFNVEQNKESWMNIIETLAEEHNIDLDTQIISVYFEWCGGNIQKNACVSGLDKMAIIFKHFKVSPIEPSEEIPAVWYETKVKETDAYGDFESFGWVCNETNRIFNVHNFPTYDIEIDFNQPLMSQNEMIKLVEEVIEPNSPVGKQFGIENNIGEGIVVSFMYKDQLFSFKVKGEKHSSSKVKTLKPVDEEKEQKKQEVAQKVTPAWRLEQMFDEANDVINGGEPTIKNIGTFLKLLNKDILKEESDTIADAGFEPKEIFGSTSKIAKVWYQDQLNELVGL